MQPAIDNMFDEMLKWPGKYRSYFALAQPLWAAKAVPLRLSASEQERNLENDVLRKRLDAGLCINRHKWSNKSVPSTQTMVWEGPKKGSRHNPPLPECRAAPRKWLADATLLCQSISIWRASAPYSYMLLHQLYVLYCIYCIYCILYSHDMSCCSKGITTKPAIFTRALCNSSE